MGLNTRIRRKLDFMDNSKKKKDSREISNFFSEFRLFRGLLPTGTANMGGKAHLEGKIMMNCM